MRIPLVTMAVLCLAFAGCIGAKPAPETPAAVNASAEGGLNLQAMATGAPTSPVAATLDAPPEWRQGEWWTVTVHDGFDSATYTGTRVVAGAEPDAYLVGMPADKFSTELMVLHIPGFGQVAKKDLSFDVHNVNFAPVSFPLTEGKTWKTAFEGRPITAVAHVKSPTEALVQLDGPNDHMNVTYDATIGEVRKIDYANYATVEVTGHGYGYQGLVTVPHMFKLVFQQFRLGGVVGPGNAPAAPDETVNVDNTYDRVSFVEILAGASALTGQAAPTGGGYFDEQVTGPDGKVYETTLMPTEGGSSPYKLAFFSVDKPGGVWKFHHVAAGPGVAEAEGIAYHVYDIELPSGRVLPSTGQHHHGG